MSISTRQENFMLNSLSLLFLSSILSAEAAEPKPHQPIVQVMTTVTYPVSLQPVNLLPPSLTQGVNMGVPINGRWNLAGEVDMCTSFAEFHPSLQILAGPVIKLDKKFSLGATALYRMNPAYAGTATSHTLGGAIVPIIPLTIGSLSFPTGVTYNTSTGGWTMGSSVKLGLRMP